MVLPDSIQRYAPELWESARPLYEAGRYADAADRGRELIAAYPHQADLFYNTACCQSLAARTADAVEHLSRAIELWEGGVCTTGWYSGFRPVGPKAGA